MKYIYSIIIASILLLSFSCEDRLAREFQDPEKHNPSPDEIIPGMFTKILSSRFYVQDYGEWWWHFNGGFGFPSYAQILVRRPHPNEMDYWSDWSDLSGNANFYTDMKVSDRFNYFYTDVKNWGLMKDEFKNLSGKEFDDNHIYLQLSTALKNGLALQMVDLFNRIPYTEAFRGTEGIFFPKYDDAAATYRSAILELEELANRIDDTYLSMSSKAKEVFSKQDIAFSGDISKWVQFINSLRLRHSVRISGVDPEFAKKQIVEAIKNLPQTDFIWPNTQKNENKIGNSAGGILARAIYERSYSTLIPNIIMQRMNYGDLDYEEGEDDPRLPVIATPIRYSSKNWQFNGCSMNFDALYPYWPTKANPDGSAFDAGPGLTMRTFVNFPTDINQWLRSAYSQYNIATFTFGEIPSYMASRAENDLLLAEVETKQLVNTGTSASEHIYNSVIHSTDFWYKVNSYSTFHKDQLDGIDSLKRVFSPDKPASEIIQKFANKIKGEFDKTGNEEDKMEIIMQQKYIHLNLLDIFELWTELRRTRHPKLEKLLANKVKHDPMPERVKYPSSEIQYNMNNFGEVSKENNFTSPIFWLPENKKNISYYRDDYLPLKGYLPLPDPNPNVPGKE